jgi:replicative DNA helicase
MDAVVERLPSKEFFYDTAHAIIYDAMLDLHSRQKPVEMIGLQSLLTKRECLEHAGGISYLMQLENDIPTIAALDFYLENVEVNAIRRRGVAIFTDLVRECFESSCELPDLLDSIERQAMALRTGRAAEIKPLPGVVDSVMRQIEDITQHKGIRDAIPTGFPGLDRQLTSGLCGSKMIIIAARPSEGKTAIAANIIEHVAIDCGPG